MSSSHAELTKWLSLSLTRMALLTEFLVQLREATGGYSSQPSWSTLRRIATKTGLPVSLLRSLSSRSRGRGKRASLIATMTAIRSFLQGPLRDAWESSKSGLKAIPSNGSHEEGPSLFEGNDS